MRTASEIDAAGDGDRQQTTDIELTGSVFCSNRVSRSRLVIMQLNTAQLEFVMDQFTCRYGTWVHKLVCALNHNRFWCKQRACVSSERRIGRVKCIRASNRSDSIVFYGPIIMASAFRILISIKGSHSFLSAFIAFNVKLKIPFRKIPTLFNACVHF